MTSTPTDVTQAYQMPVNIPADWTAAEAAFNGLAGEFLCRAKDKHGIVTLLAYTFARHRLAHQPGDGALLGDLAAIGPRPTGRVLAWADPRPCFYQNSIGECGHCVGCKERLALAALQSSEVTK